MFRSICWIAFIGCWPAAATAYAEEPVSFNRDIRPILSDKCFQCHGPDQSHRQADLRLDDEESAKAGRDGVPVVVAGRPEQSELIARITADDEDLRMPPADTGKPLTPREIELIRQWIADGAEWAPHWAYVPPQRHPVPDVPGAEGGNWIDRFIAARHRRPGLAFQPEADRVTLIRRASFDLTGLPPTPDEVEAFANSSDPQAYEQLVDRLLQSEHFGERMAVYWLDLVRYADTVGYHGDQDHHISPYRDWVIDAFNANLPFDRFTREQLAGDLLPEAGVDQKIASGYNRLLQTSHEGGVQPKEYLAMYAADRVRNVSAVWMGATVGCAQCHDHKYDPYTIDDFYTLSAFFADIDEAQHFRVGNDAVPTRRPPEIKVLTRRERERLAELEAKIAQLQTRLEQQADAEQPGADQAGREADPSAANDLRRQIEGLEKQAQAVRDSARMTMITVSIEPRTTRVFPRGNWLDESGPVVQPAIPQFLGTLDVGDRRATRLDLANWLLDAESGAGGLTARVMVNRLWYLLFGVGLSNSLDDFGGQGEAPVHPELLDNLTLEFIDSGWDVQHLLKLMMMSRTYRQSSAAPPETIARDPENRLYARQSRFRLPAEFIRDNALAVSGLLVTEVGGGSVKPYQPGGYYRHLNFPKREYQHHDDERQWRRGVYLHWQRQFVHPMLKAFDAPRREECTAQRPKSNTPLAALVLLNDPSFVEAARVFAEQIVRSGETTEARLNFACRRTLSRQPDEDERTILTQLLHSNLDRYRADVEAARALITTGQAPTADDLDAADLAAWTMVARALLNLNETNTRN